MALKIALLPGDGVGPEVLAQAVKCLKAVEETFNQHFIFKEAPVGAIAMDKTGVPLPDTTLRYAKNLMPYFLEPLVTQNTTMTRMQK